MDSVYIRPLSLSLFLPLLSIILLPPCIQTVACIICIQHLTHIIMGARVIADQQSGSCSTPFSPCSWYPLQKVVLLSKQEYISHQKNTMRIVQMKPVIWFRRSSYIGKTVRQCNGPKGSILISARPRINFSDQENVRCSIICLAID